MVGMLTAAQLIFSSSESSFGRCPCNSKYETQVEILSGIAKQNLRFGSLMRHEIENNFHFKSNCHRFINAPNCSESTGMMAEGDRGKENENGSDLLSIGDGAHSFLLLVIFRLAYSHLSGWTADFLIKSHPFRH